MQDDSRQAGTNAEEIEITPEMIEAGYQVLARSGLSDDLLEADRLTVVEMYQAMWRRRMDSVDRVDCLP